jgi:hypothetical protein
MPETLLLVQNSQVSRSRMVCGLPARGHSQSPTQLLGYAVRSVGSTGICVHDSVQVAGPVDHVIAADLHQQRSRCHAVQLA